MKEYYIEELNKVLVEIDAKAVALCETETKIEFGTAINTLAFRFADIKNRKGFSIAYTTYRSFTYKRVGDENDYIDHCRFVLALNGNYEVSAKVKEILEQYKNWVEDEFLKRLHKTA